MKYTHNMGVQKQSEAVYWIIGLLVVTSVAFAWLAVRNAYMKPHCDAIKTSQFGSVCEIEMSERHGR